MQMLLTFQKTDRLSCGVKAIPPKWSIYFFAKGFIFAIQYKKKLSPHVETVILLSRKAPDAEIKVRLDMSELDITSAESKATYKEIQEYVKNKYDLHVTNLYIAQGRQIQAC